MTSTSDVSNPHSGHSRFLELLDELETIIEADAMAWDAKSAQAARVRLDRLAHLICGLAEKLRPR